MWAQKKDRTTVYEVRVDLLEALMRCGRDVAMEIVRSRHLSLVETKP